MIDIITNSLNQVFNEAIKKPEVIISMVLALVCVICIIILVILLLLRHHYINEEKEQEMDDIRKFDRALFEHDPKQWLDFHKDLGPVPSKKGGK